MVLSQSVHPSDLRLLLLHVLGPATVDLFGSDGKLLLGLDLSLLEVLADSRVGECGHVQLTQQVLGVVTEVAEGEGACDVFEHLGVQDIRRF